MGKWLSALMLIRLTVLICKTIKVADNAICYEVKEAAEHDDSQ